MNFQEMWNEAEAEKKIVDITPQWVPWEAEGQFIIGRFRGSSEVTSSLGEGTYLQYLFDTDDGLVKFSLGRATDNELKTVMVVGHVFQISYLGQDKIKGGRHVNKFKVQTIPGSSDAGQSPPESAF